MALTEETLKMARISGLGYAEATDYMTNAIRSFKMEMTDAQRVVDVYSEIAASSATSTTELANAMSKTASSAEAVGSSFENTTAMMAVMIEATRESAENIGSAMKSIISRYGEMTSDPTKLVDSEGQEMSLNRVDKALQTVGISIHDAAGQFRNFDDVITELAGKWDTIDANTQRYIATIMAGNRQQSRFLALVSNGERLAELSEKAANSQDAATLQVLKTMDSIEAKTQQFKTSLQSLYTEAGIEDLYKILLNVGNNIVKTFTAMPKTFNLPILAVSKFASQFVNLGTLVTNASVLIKSKLKAVEAEIQAELTAATQNGVNQRIAAEESGAERAAAAIQKKVEANRQAEERMVNDTKMASDERANIANGEANNTVNAKKGMSARSRIGLGMGVSAIGMIGSTFAGNIDVNKNRDLKKWMTGLSSAIQGVGSGLMVGGAPGAILGAITALPGIIEAIGMASESTEEKISRLGAAITETSNKELQSKDELKTLTDFKQKYDELAKSRYKDSDSRQAWLDLNNSIAQSYPQFISYIDEEGNKIVNLGENYNQLLAAKQAVYEADNLQASVAQLEALSDVDYVMQSLLDASAHIKTSDEGLKIFGLSTILGSADAHDADFATKWLTEVNDELEQANGNFEKFQEIFESVHGQSFNDVRNALLNGATFDINYTDAFGIGDRHKMDLAVSGAMGSYLDQIANNWDLYNNQVSEFIKSQVKILSSYFGNKSDYGFTDSALALDQVSIELYKKWQEVLKTGQEQGLDLTTIYANFYANIPKYLEEINNQLFTDFDFSESNNILSQAEKIFQAPENFSKKYIENLSEDIKNIFTDEQLQDIVDKTAKNYTNAVNQVNDLIQNSLVSGDINFNQDTLDVAHYNEMLGNVAGQYYNSYVEQLAALLNSQNYSSEAKQAAIGQMYFLRDAIQRENNLNEAQMNEVDQLLSNADLTSLTGISELKQGLEGLSFVASNIDFSFLIDNIIPNLIIEYSVLETKLSGNLSDVEKALNSATSGMDTKTALEMAAKLVTTLKDFEFKNGKWFYNDTIKLLETYEKVDSDLVEQINSAYNRAMELIMPLEEVANSPFNSGFGIFSSVYLNEAGKPVTFDALTEKGQLNAIKVNAGVDDSQAKILLDYYKQYYQDFLNVANKYDNNFWSYVREQLENSRENFEKALEAEDFIANSKLLSNGDFLRFLNKFDFADELEQQLLKNFLNGEIEDLLLWIPEEYHSTLVNTLENVNNNVLQSIFTGAKEGSYIKSTEATDIFYEAFTQGENVLLEKIADNTYKFVGNTYDALIAQIKDSNLTDNQKQALLKDIHTEQYKDNLTESLNNVISNYESASYDAIQSLANSLNTTIDNLLGSSIFQDIAPVSINDDGTFKVNLERLEQFLIFQYDKLSDESYNKIRAQLEQAKYDQDNNNIIRGIITKRNELTREDLGNLANAMKMRYEELIATLQLQQNDDGTYRMNIVTLWNKFQGQMNDTMRDYIASQIDEVISSMTGLAGSQSKGYTDLVSMQKYMKSLNQMGITKVSGEAYDFNELFTYNETLHAYQLTSEGLIAQIRGLQEQINFISDEQFAVKQKLMDETKRKFANLIDPEALISAIDTNQYDTIRTNFEKTINDYNSVLKAMAAPWEEVEILDAQALVGALENGGAEAIAAMQRIAEAQGQKMTAEQAESAWRAQVANYVNAIDTLTAKPGEIVDKTTADIINFVGGVATELGDSGTYLVQTAANLYNAYSLLYAKMRNSGEATLADLNKVMGLALDNRDGEQQVIDALGDAAGMTYSRFGEILTEAGVQLTTDLVQQLESSGIIKGLGGNKMQITDFKTFASLMNWDANSEQYISAFKSYNDSLIGMNRQVKRNILEEAKNVASANGGDWINLMQLTSELGEVTTASLSEQLIQFGAYLDDGILKIADNANIIGIIQTIEQTVQQSGGLITDELAELADAVADAIANYASLVSGGIKGNLNNKQANQLSDFAASYGIEKLDFHETTEGLKLSQKSATELYNVIAKIDTLQGQLVFNELRSSLEASNTGLANISTTTATITRVQQKMRENAEKIAKLEQDGGNKSKIDKIRAENKELQDQLNLYNRLAVAQSADSDSFNFMNRSMPDALKGPENYWNSVGQAYKVMNEAASSGKMAIQDFYNIVQEMSNLATISDTELDFMGQTIDGSAENAAALIRKGLGALSNIDGEGVKIDLSKLGMNVVSGAESASSNFEKGVHALAESQIEMLDAAIQLLEVVVAMESLSDLDVSNVGTLDLGEIFNIHTTGIEGDFTKEYTEWAEGVMKAAEDNEDLAKALQSISVNGVTMGQMIDAATGSIKEQTEKFKNLGLTEEQYRTVIDAFYQAVRNGDYDLDHIQSSVWDILNKTLPDGTALDIGKRTLVIAGGTQTIIDWTDPNTEQVMKELGDTEEEQRKNLQQLITRYQTGNLNEENSTELTQVLTVLGKVTVNAETGEVTINDHTYSSLDDPKAQEELIRTALELKGAENITISDTSDDLTLKGTKKIGNTEFTLTNSGGNTTYTYTDENGNSYSGTSINEAIKQEVDAKIAEFEGYDQLSDEEKLEVEKRIAAEITCSVLGAELTVQGSDKSLGETLKISRDQLKEEISAGMNIGNLGEDGKYHIELSTGITVDLPADADINDALIDSIYSTTEQQFDVNGLITKVAEGIKQAFEGESGEAIGQAIWTGISKVAANSGTTDGQDGKTIEIPQMNVAVTNLDISSVGDTTISAPTEGENGGLSLEEAAANVEDLSINEITKSHYDSTLTLTDDIATGEANVTNMTVGATSFTAAGSLQALQGMNFATTSTSLSSIASSTGKIGKASFDNFSALSSVLVTIKDQVDSIWSTIQNFANQTFTVNMNTTGGSNTTNNVTTNASLALDTSAAQQAVAALGTTIGVLRGNCVTTTQVMERLRRSMDIPQQNVSRIQTLFRTLQTNFSDNARRVSSLANAMKNIPSVADRITKLSTAIGNIPKTKSAAVTLKYSVTRANAAGNIGGFAKAKGTGDALAKGQKTLMGELGPELVVSHGRYFLVGEAGAEFVNLDKDAIVFNHKQTRRLMRQGAIGSRGKPTTNENNAVSFAKGNYKMPLSGPAKENRFVDLERGVESGHTITPEKAKQGSSQKISSVKVSPNYSKIQLFSYAKGNVGGRAMASASDTLALLKELREMWRSMLEASAKDLGSLAGKGRGGGGGGGGGGGSSPDNSGYIHDLEIWYNLLRQIAKLEKDITYQQKLQSKLLSDRNINGQAVYESMKKELKYTDTEIAKQKQLLSLQEDYYLKAIEKSNNSVFGKIFTYDEEGLMQYNSDLSEYIKELTKNNSSYFDKDGKIHIKGQNQVRDDEGNVVKDDKGNVKTEKFDKTVDLAKSGMDLLSIINATDDNGKAIHTAEEQVEILKAFGYGDVIKYDASGKEIDTSSDDYATKMVKAFWDKIEGIQKENDTLFDAMLDTQNEILDEEQHRNEILQKITDNQIALENEVVQAIENREQAVIDELQDERDALEKSATKFIDGLNKSLNKERELYNKNQEAQELTKMQRQLAILQRSGGSASQIRSLQEQIASKQQEAYFNEQQAQIDAIQEASDLEIERLDTQIELLTETLEYQKENGLLWNEVYEIMAKAPEEIKDFIREYDKEYRSQSTLQQSESDRDLDSMIGQYKAYEDDVKKGNDVMAQDKTYDWDTFLASIKNDARYTNVLTDDNLKEAKAAFDSVTSGDPNEKDRAAREVLNKKIDEYNKAHNNGNGNSGNNGNNGNNGGSTGTKEEEKEEEKKEDNTQYWGEGTIKKGSRYYTYDSAKSSKKGPILSGKESGASYKIIKVSGNRAQIDQVYSNGKRAPEFDKRWITYNDKKHHTWKKYAAGGAVDYTGLAWVDGTPSKPEGFLNAEQTAALKEGMSPVPTNLVNVLTDLAVSWRNAIGSGMAAVNNQENSSVVIEKAEVNMNVQSMDSSYDARRAGSDALDEILKIARKSGTRGINRR